MMRFILGLVYTPGALALMAQCAGEELPNAHAVGGTAEIAGGIAVVVTGANGYYVDQAARTLDGAPWRITVYGPGTTRETLAFNREFDGVNHFVGGLNSVLLGDAVLEFSDTFGRSCTILLEGAPTHPRTGVHTPASWVWNNPVVFECYMLEHEPDFLWRQPDSSTCFTQLVAGGLPPINGLDRGGMVEVFCYPPRLLLP
jgi:hypothetical protein